MESASDELKGQESGQDQSLIVPVWVSSSENPENKQLTYVLLDCQSNATFITKKLREELGIELNWCEEQLAVLYMRKMK